MKENTVIELGFEHADVQALMLNSKILIVEDDEELLDYLESVLADQFNVHVASNGFEALNLLDKEDFDLIVSDIGMPEMDGYEFLRKVRMDRQDLIPFLFLTGYTKKSDIIQGLLLGVDAYITKPFEIEELLARVQGLLLNNHRRKSAYSQLAPAEDDQEDEAAAKTDLSFRSRWLKNLESLIKDKLSDTQLRVPDLAFSMAVSERTLRNRIREYTGLSPHEYLMEARMNKAKELLENRVYLSVAEVTHAVGLEHSSYFTKQFKNYFGKAPSEYL